EWGDLYILYNTIELGTKILYLIKSHDNGITWGNPVEITRIVSDSEDFRYAGAAWGPVITIYVRDVGAGEDLLYRSFNGGEFFESPIPLINLVGADIVEKLILTNNGSLFLLYRNSPTLYTILESPDLGFTWSISTQWLDYPQNFTRILDMQADMVYDGEHDLLHVLLPYLNLTLVANYSVATLDVSSGIWREPRGMDTLFPMGLFSREPKLLITRAPDPPHIQIKIIYIHDQQPMGGWIDYTIKEIVSDDLGATWAGPTIVSASNNATQFTSSTFDIFYVSQKSDGNDYEIYFSREGGLTRTKKETLSSGINTKISFDGLDDFGDYISEGNYSYNLHIRDEAGNFIDTHGWFYADYTNPTITEPEDNWDFEPTPRLDVEIRADIGDNTSVSAILYYKKDLGPWIPVPMESIGGFTYLAMIPNDNITNTVQYYIEAMDLAGNTVRRDAGGSYYTYDLPDYNWIYTGLFNETTTYSSSQNYEISISITTDFEYVLNIVFRYSTDGGSTWNELELLPNSPEFTGYLENIPGDTRTLMYQVVLNDIFGQQVILMDTQQISFFPEIPSLSITGSQSAIIIIIAAVVGFLVAYGYIQLKGKSHEVIYRQIFLREYTKRSMTVEETSVEEKTRKKRGKKREIADQNGILSKKYVGTSPFTIAYLGILSATLIVFIVGYFYSEFNPQGGILLLAASLVLSIFGYMILISRDISLNIYLEKIFKRNIILEFFQIIFMLLIIIMILFKGFAIPWFRYYLIEQTYEIGTLSIPKLYISVFGVFFTSLVLVMITTYLQLKKTVKNVRKQRAQGATDNLLLFVKDQNSSRLITQMGYKTIAFLVTVLIGIVTTTNLLTVETGLALLVVVIPFIISGFSGLIVHRLLERRKQKKEAEEIELPFIDSKKVCNKCGESIYLTNKYCGSCGSQEIYTDNVGIYTSKCTKCNGYIYDKAEFCPTCGNEVAKQE
ncbi:MAG: double zinc ribbon domain-containing protein, partial [Promethearchaeota archaeon]